MSKDMARCSCFYRGTFILQEASFGIEYSDAGAFEHSIAPLR